MAGFNTIIRDSGLLFWAILWSR